MTTRRIETVPGTWDDARDEGFFGITARLFPPQFCLGATVLLASSDDDVPVPVVTVAPAPVARSTRRAGEPVRPTRGTAA